MALVVITGGARSGKSRAAQELAAVRYQDGQPVTVVVFGSASDAEMTERIARHQADRPLTFALIEAEDSLSWIARLPEGHLLVVDCLGTCLGRVMLEAWEAVANGADMADADGLPEGLEAHVGDVMGNVVSAVLARTGDTIVVTNEVGSSVVPAYATGRLFRDELGRANRRLIDRAQASYLAIAGRLLDLESLPRTALWPED